MPEMVKGYYTDPVTGITTEHDMYKGDLLDACNKWPKDWSKTGKATAAAGAATPKPKKFGKARKTVKSALSPFAKPATSSFDPPKPPAPKVEP